MEPFQACQELAAQKLRIADHILTATYPLVKDPRLLVAVMDNIFLSLSHGMTAALHYERQRNRIPAFADTFEAKFRLFREEVMPRYHLNPDYASLLQGTKELILERKRSPMEFARKDCYVICSEGYRTRTVSIQEMKQLIGKARVFIQEITHITAKHEYPSR